ncbi:hypothetical protein HMPREF0860_1532 [Treponema socranskii subsp. socranskii VPI DR56BR1116 = ATCC 35536]|uniref:Uncharacterized protein n=2 Tax=Treponema socranskii TaxID=53419 RepID=U2LIS3_TRESO|nr:hypothetical protein HMPREF1325_2489 [Treponema socranskii subsp. socranskii VPI DR56BR1116 = ATCC 35536]ERK04146.1 hypothetical protein HMPREF0860_1532 [Treponema socranskii subsp. socranskii VPI DR56BR1116 = ATCC 35536]
MKVDTANRRPGKLRVYKTSKFVPVVIMIVLCCLLFSCSDKTKPVATATGDRALSVSAAGEDAASLKLPAQLWHVSDEVVCILFGYGYNDAAFVASMTETLSAKYGAASDGGLILPIVFPDDFKRGSRSIAAELPLLVGEKKLRGVILLGAPENTHFGVAHLQDRYDGVFPFPVFSFFSQDDVSGTEGTADIVLDKAQEADIDGVIKNESEQVFVKEVPDFVRRSVNFMLTVDGALAKDNDLLVYLKKITGNAKMRRYVDPESGLQSVNHFILAD